MSPLVCADRFPVDVWRPDGERLHKAKLVLTAPEAGVAPRLLVAVAHGTWAVDTVWDPATSHVPGSGAWQVDAVDGPYRVESNGGCRCGRLAHWHPFTPERRAALAVVTRRAREGAAS